MNQPSNSLKPSQKIALKAWKIALNNINFEQLPEAVQENIEQIKIELDKNNYQVLNKISDIVQRDPNLNEAYETAWEKLTADYNSQERTKSAATIEETNILSFSINDSVERTKSKPSRKALLILQALDTYPLTLDDLKYRLNLPAWEVHKLIKQLWNERRINKVSGNIWYNFLPITKRGELIIDDDDSDTYFTLTSLGKLHLHSLVNSR